MIKSILSVLISLLLFMFLVSSLYADLIYDNGGPNQISSNEMTQFIQTQSFMLPTAQFINGVKFWAGDYSNDGGAYIGQITYFIYADSTDSPGTPGVILASGTLDVTPVATGIVKIFAGPFVEYLFDFNILPFYASANTIYHLGLHNGPISNISYRSLGWETTEFNETSTGMRWNLYLKKWEDNQRENAFQLFGSAVSQQIFLPLIQR